VKKAGAEGASIDDAAKSLLLDPVTAGSICNGLEATGALRGMGRGRFVHPDALEEAHRDVVAWMTAELSEGRLVLGRAEAGAHCRLSPRVLSEVLRDLHEKGMVDVSGNFLLASEERLPWPQAVRDLLARVRATYRETGYHSPNRQQLDELLQADASARGGVLDYLIVRGEVRDLGGNVLLDRTHFGDAQGLVVGILKKEGQLDSGVFKTRLGSTRKYALAVLDALDAAGVTVRTGNMRRLAPGAGAQVVS
jgi:hypothetical protein